MSALTDYLENAILNHIRNGAAFAQPAGLYLALFSTATTDAGGGTELSGNNYSRPAVTFGAASGGTIANTAAADFEAIGADWPQATHAALCDAATAGNRLVHGPLTAAKTVEDGDSLVFKIGEITFSLD